MQISWPLWGAPLKARLEHQGQNRIARDAVFGGACGETGACRIPHRIYEVLSSCCHITPARIACAGCKKAKRGGEVSIVFSRFPCPYVGRRFVPKSTARETASTARVGPLRDPGAK